MKRALFILLLISLSIGIFPWKEDIQKYLSSRVKNYQAAANYLARELDSAAPEDVPHMVMILAYCHSANGDPASEFVYIKNYYENHYDKFRMKEIDFLPQELQLAISDFYHLWSQKYPLASDIKPESSKMSFNELVKGSFTITLNSLNQVAYNLYRNNSLIANGTFIKGLNKITIQGIDLSKSQTISDLFLEMGSGNNLIRKNLILEIKTDIPKEVFLEQGVLSFKDSQFKSETTFKINQIETKYFDKSFFYKHSLVNFGIAAIFMAGDFALFSPRQDELPVYNSLHKFSQLFSISLSVVGIVNLAKSFKTKITEEKIPIVDEGARQHNQFLKERLESIKSSIFAAVSIMARVI